ncbi:MAG: sulfate ABC transporter substrate-binding protein [Oscillospiraceae bacterium]|nr:sulfate ABC transporter substrate-binding protein [Oscillospiraceae bacterium]
MNRFVKILAVILTLALLCSLFASCKKEPVAVSLSSLSLGSADSFYEEYNKSFAAYWLNLKGEKFVAQQADDYQSNTADVLTLALEPDADKLLKSITDGGAALELPNKGVPFTTTAVFLVRSGNPKKISDWDSLAKAGRELITANPKSSSEARCFFLAAWGYAEKNYSGGEIKSTEFLKAIYVNAAVLYADSRSAAFAFINEQRGDVLLTTESAAYLALKEHPDEYEIVVPSMSIAIQPQVAILNAKSNGKEELAKAYLEYLYSTEAQQLAGLNYYRPYNPEILALFDQYFDLNMPLLDISDFGGWAQAEEKFFADGRIFDEIYMVGTDANTDTSSTDETSDAPASSETPVTSEPET